jgi:hypothetical protein
VKQFARPNPWLLVLVISGRLLEALGERAANVPPPPTLFFFFRRHACQHAQSRMHAQARTTLPDVLRAQPLEELGERAADAAAADALERVYGRVRDVRAVPQDRPALVLSQCLHSAHFL